MPAGLASTLAISADQLQGRFVKQTKLAELRLHGNVSKFGCEKTHSWRCVDQKGSYSEAKNSSHVDILSISFDDMTVMAASTSRFLKSAGNGFFR